MRDGWGNASDPSISNGRAHGSMRYVYVDEAGKSENEPVTVVVGIIVDADTQYGPAELELRSLIQSAPAHYRQGLIVHAASIWGDPKYRDGWSLEERLDFLKRAASIPRKVGAAMAIAYMRRTHPGDPENKLTRATYHFQQAFALCIAHADRFVREQGRPGEISTVVAEDTDEKRTLRALVRALSSNEAIIVPAASQVAFPNRERADHVYTIRTVKDTVHFVEKVDGPLLQIADVCAFAYRRYFSDQDYGSALVASVIDTRDLKQPEPVRRTFFGSLLYVPPAPATPAP
jgi:hypothetical protein